MHKHSIAVLMILGLLIGCGSGGGGRGSDEDASRDVTLRLTELPVRDVHAAPDASPALLAEVPPDFILGVCIHPQTAHAYDILALERTLVLAIDIWMSGITTDWMVDVVPDEQVDFLTVALHEFGHVIGINAHLPTGAGIMQAELFYGEAGRQRALSSGDIALLHEAEVLFGLAYIGRVAGCDVEIAFVEFDDPAIIAVTLNQQFIAFDLLDYYFVHDGTEPPHEVVNPDEGIFTR